MLLYAYIRTKRSSSKILFQPNKLEKEHKVYAK